MKKKLLIVRGLPGSGKSTYAKSLLASGSYDSHHETDNYFMVGGVYKFDPKMLGVNHGRCFKDVRKDMENNLNVIVSNTFTRIWEFEKYIELAKNMGYKCIVLKCVGRYNNVHGVPQTAINNMAARWEDYDGEIILSFGFPNLDQ